MEELTHYQKEYDDNSYCCDFCCPYETLCNKEANDCLLVDEGASCTECVDYKNAD